MGRNLAMRYRLGLLPLLSGRHHGCAEGRHGATSGANGMDRLTAGCTALICLKPGSALVASNGPRVGLARYSSRDKRTAEFYSPATASWTGNP